MERYLEFSTPIGRLCLIADQGEIIRIASLDGSFRPDPVQLSEDDHTDCSSEDNRNNPECALLVDAKEQILEYLDGKRKFFTFPIHEDGTPFAIDVKEAAKTVPYGQTITYEQLAKNAGHPGAYRAAARVMSTNKFPLVIPCHRILPKDKPVEQSRYSFCDGAATRKYLLDLEQKNSQ